MPDSGDASSKSIARSDFTGLSAKRMPGKQLWKPAIVVVWLLTTLALASWWMIFGLKQLARYQDLGRTHGATTELANEFARQHRMLLSEGVTLILLLLIGGAALLYYIFSEIRRSRLFQEFFAGFTHELKTSLASLRLQAESLEEDLQDSGQSRLARRLVKDTVRLELQLENSLLLSNPDDSRLLIEEHLVSEVLQPMRHHWPELEIIQIGDGVALADTRALESIFKNFLQNAVVHGRSTRACVTVAASGDEMISLKFEDNGRGFKGDPAKLGRMFHRHTSTSGSGLGLYLVTRLVTRMRGELRLLDSTLGGFGVEVVLPGRQAEQNRLAHPQSQESR